MNHRSDLGQRNALRFIPSFMWRVLVAAAFAMCAALLLGRDRAAKPTPSRAPALAAASGASRARMVEVAKRQKERRSAPPVDDGRSGSEATTDLLHRMTERLASATRVERCGPPATAACRRARSDGFYAGIAAALHTDEVRTEGERIAREFGGETLRSAIDRVCESSANEFERIAALTLLDIVDLPSRGFAANVYRDLRSKTAPEAQLVLSQHASEPPPLDAVGEVHALASAVETDERVRTAAIRALGHRSTADQLNDLAERAADADSVTMGDVVTTWGPALGGCGQACLPGYRAIFFGSRTDSTDMLRRALEMVRDPSERAAIDSDLGLLQDSP